MKKAKKTKKVKKISYKKSKSKSKRKGSAVAKPKAQKYPFEAKDFLSMKEVTTFDLETLFKLAEKMKKDPEAYFNKLKGKSIALLFQKPSMRTRISFEVGMAQLGGYTVYMDPQEMPLGERESIKDVARVISRYCQAVVARTFIQADVEEFAKYASIPVINGLTAGEPINPKALAASFPTAVPV